MREKSKRLIANIVVQGRIRITRDKSMLFFLDENISWHFAIYRKAINPILPDQENHIVEFYPMPKNLQPFQWETHTHELAECETRTNSLAFNAYTIIDY